MNYTIATIYSVQRDFSVSLGIDGNSYVVSASNSNGFASHNYYSLDDAFKMFTQLSRLIVYGLYADNDRMQILREDIYVKE